jgi:TRAP-type C4-dicarboxylate transport system permease large subunit
MNGLTKIPLRDIIAEIWPFIGILVATILLLILVPDLILWLPKYFGYQPA